MSPAPEPLQRVADAERAVRRGDLKEALRLYGQLLTESPDDQAIRARVAAIQSLVQPSELDFRREPRAAPSPRLEAAATAEQMAEMLFERGDYPGALAAYARILHSRPDHQLALERFTEIKGLVELSPPSPRPALAQDKSGLLEALLARVSERRRR